MSELPQPASAIDGLYLPWTRKTQPTGKSTGIELCESDWQRIEDALDRAGFVVIRKLPPVAVSVSSPVAPIAPLRATERANEHAG